MRILGRLNSVNVQKVVWCAQELGLGYERLDVGGKFGGNTTPEYLAKNPNGRVPVLEDGDLVLWESNAIARYLAAKHGAGTLWPIDPAVRALSDRWMDWGTMTLNAAIHTAFWQTIRTPEEQRDAAAIAKSAAESQAAMDILDGALAGKAFVLGEQFSMGDIVVGCSTHRWINLPIGPKPGRHVQAWYERILQRPAVKSVLITPIT